MLDNPVLEYLESRKGGAAGKVSLPMLSYLSNLQQTAAVAPEIAASIVRELENQRSRIKLIASENYCSMAVQLAMGNLFTDKYAEGMPGHRFYAGNENVDEVERAAQSAACRLFGAEYANVQPHCGADANMLAYWAILTTRVEKPQMEAWGKTNLYDISDSQWHELKTALGSQRLLGMDYSCGGHLTHGYRYNMSARLFDVYGYVVDRQTGLLDYDAIEKQALEVRPLILLAGYSAYSRKISFRRFREIADKAGAVLMVDMAHFGGLVAGKVFTGDYSPLPWAHVVTSTTHKTLRGPRAGFVLSTKEFAPALDKGCPLTMGGPLPHVIAAKAVAFNEALKPEFQTYAANIVKNARALAASCVREGLEVLTGGTDNHLLLVNVHPWGLTGRQAEAACHECGVTLNRNALPFDPNGPWYTSGLRIGSAAMTTLGMGEAEMDEIGAIIALVLRGARPAPDAKDPSKPSRTRYTLEAAVKAEAQKRAASLLSRFPVYPELDLPFLKRAFVP